MLKGILCERAERKRFNTEGTEEAQRALRRTGKR
jgi:hypothetical protein